MRTFSNYDYGDDLMVLEDRDSTTVRSFSSYDDDDDLMMMTMIITTLVSELQRLPDELLELKCDKCQYGGLREHREEKHRIWDCLCCCATFPNKIAFGKHPCVLHPLGMPYLGRPKQPKL